MSVSREGGRKGGREGGKSMNTCQNDDNHSKSRPFHCTNYFSRPLELPPPSFPPSLPHGWR